MKKESKIQNDKELQDAMNKLGTAFEMARKDQDKIRRRYTGSGDKIKLYARRAGDTSKHFHYSDAPTRERTDWILNVMETVLGLKVSGSILIRRAILALYMDMIDLMMNHKGSDPKDFNEYLDRLDEERRLLYDCANTTVADVIVITSKNKNAKLN